MQVQLPPGATSGGKEQQAAVNQHSVVPVIPIATPVGVVRVKEEIFDKLYTPHNTYHRCVGTTWWVHDCWQILGKDPVFQTTIVI